MSFRAGIGYGLLGFGFAFLAGVPLGTAALCGLGAGIVGGILSELPPVRRAHIFVRTTTQPYYSPYYDWGVSRVRRVRTYWHEQTPHVHHHSYQQQSHAHGHAVPPSYQASPHVNPTHHSTSVKHTSIHASTNAQPTPSRSWFPSFSRQSGPKSHPAGVTHTHTTHVTHGNTMAPAAPPSGTRSVSFSQTSAAPSSNSHSRAAVTRHIGTKPPSYH